MARKVFKEAQFFNKQKSLLPVSCKDKSGNILSELGDTLQRWIQYFCDLQTSSGTEELISENVILSNSEVVPPPTYYEVNQVIERLKIHTAAGLDSIPAELITQGGTELKTRVHKLIMKIWDEETLPTEWMEGIICPIYKKGDRMICSNYRPITLLNVVYKIFSFLINNRITKIVERKLEDCQIRFRSNRSTIDNIFTVRQIMEKCHEFNIELRNILFDYTHAFDSVFRNKIIECLNKYEIPSKLIKPIARALQDTKARVKVNQNYTEKFEITTGVKQGDLLLAALFSIVIDDILKQLELSGNISTRLK